MFKKMFICTVMMVTLIAFCMSAQAAEIVIKFADTVAPDHPNHLAAVKFAEIMAQKTNGRVRVDTFPAAQLGNEKELIEGTMLGSVDMFQASPGALSLFQPEFGILDCPYIFRDLDHVYKTVRGPIGAELAEKIAESRGIQLLAMDWYYGARHLTTRDKAIKTPADLKGMLIRAPEQPVYLEAVRAMGGTPTPVDFSDLYMALKQGTVDGQENPIPTIYTYKFYEAQKFIMMTGHMIRIITVGTNASWFNNLPKDIQTAIQESLAEAGAYNNDLVQKQEKDLISNLKEEGMTVVEPDVEAFRKASQSVHLKFEDKWGKGLYEKIVAVE
jgi:tripartite ATP-independent transporter DctP family solute receptor